MADVKQLVKLAKSKRENRVYYEQYFNVSSLLQSGIVQDEKKTLLDRAQLDSDRNELIQLFGFTHNDGSYFELKLTVASLYVTEGVQSSRKIESKWRLANVEFMLYLADGNQKFSYQCEQLLDYDEKRQARDKHEHRNIHKVGSLSIETVRAYSLSRILFNGLIKVETRAADGSGVSIEHKPVKLTISTHPTCDKFDYRYRFDSEHSVDVISKSLGSGQQADRLLELMLEDRVDQPMMFQGQLESLEASPGGDGDKPKSFTMWGAKVKKFLDARNELAHDKSPLRDETRDCLFAWTECGHQVHLTRPEKNPNLIYGLVHNSYDYASCLLDAKLCKMEAGQEKCIEFGDLDSFLELTGSHVIKLRAFKVKDYRLEFKVDNSHPAVDIGQPIRIKLNQFDGWALRLKLDLGQQIKVAQQKLLVHSLNVQLCSFKLAEERLLGGKGHSLTNLVQLVQFQRLAQVSFAPQHKVDVTVPRGLVVTSEAYQLWLRSSPKILQAIQELDTTRLTLAAASVNLDPMSSSYVSLGQAQKLLRDQCQKTHDQLVSCPLPDVLRRKLSKDLVEMFGEEELKEASDGENKKLFAVRSSAVGEDSLETSAAGQMKTILDAHGLNSICQAVVECWSSQFELEALTYKSQNGLQLNLPMAVVVQELIQCHVAGVAATCDPLSGNKAKLEITANLGLGEGVVSGKQTDTVRVRLDHSSRWDSQLEEFIGELSLESNSQDTEKLPGAAGDCCLTDEQIVALSNLLLEIRRASEIKEREVEWGITLAGEGQFRIHLLQSRPLTHLQRLSTHEIDHELDWGLLSPLDLVSRANLGEVMPGALCPLDSSWFFPIVASHTRYKPVAPNQSRGMFVSEQFAFHSQMAMLVITYGDFLKRFDPASIEEDKNQKMDAKWRDMTSSMLGTAFTEPEDDEERQRNMMFSREKVSPLTPNLNHSFMEIVANDLVGLHYKRLDLLLELQRTTLVEDLIPKEQLIKQRALNQLESQSSLDRDLYAQINLLHTRLLTTTGPLLKSWVMHTVATVASITFNMMTLTMLGTQPAYAGSQSTANEVLNDLSVLLREPKGLSDKLGQQTESGDISKLLDLLLECFVQDNLLDRVKSMKAAELYEFLTDVQNQTKLKCCKLYRDFMAKNGHRAWKESCLATKTWSDDPSYVVRALAMRLKSYTPDEAAKAKARRIENETRHEAKLAEVLAKVTNGKFVLMNYAVPRARNATIRREESKSMLIKVVHMYRLAFRHLGGLLCLAGLLPQADLIFFLTIKELDEVIRKCCTVDSEQRRPRGDLMPRLLYKARRRQQRSKVFDRVTFPRPTIRVLEMLQTIRQQTQELDGGAPAATQQQVADQSPNRQEDENQVRGITSCSGRVTGRACVISSLDEVDQIEPNDILITYAIDISWSVYFFTLSGIVTEVGGIVSHGAVVAREYGLPTLCTAIGACSKFKTGQMVTLDANKGICYLAEESTSQGPDEIPPVIAS